MLDCQTFLKKGISINLYISTAAIELGKNHLYEVPLLVWINCVGGGAGVYRHISLFCKKKNVLIRTFFKNV